MQPIWCLNNKRSSQFTNEELKLWSYRMYLKVVVLVRNLPMRSWNLNCFPASSEWVSEVRNLPMRSWNNSTEPLVVGSNVKFAIYQWGVETFFIQFFVYSFSCCSQFTNEELKLSKSLKNFLLCDCSQFTNEELKPMYVNQFSFPLSLFAIYQWGVETTVGFSKQSEKPSSQFTNEELKPFIIVVPSSLSAMFAIYQWGVETL